MAKKKGPSQGIAIVALLLNILVLPGLGTLIAGRTTPGVIQLVLFLIGIPLSLVLIGIPLMIGMWIWALVTGIQIVQEAS
jgi:TM2 domain-containing membrane protein YozV